MIQVPFAPTVSWVGSKACSIIGLAEDKTLTRLGVSCAADCTPWLKSLEHCSHIRKSRGPFQEADVHKWSHYVLPVERCGRLNLTALKMDRSLRSFTTATQGKRRLIGQQDRHSDDFKSLLDSAASKTEIGLTFYRQESTVPKRTSYHDLRQQALQNACAIQRIPGFKAHKPLLLHFDNHEDNILWLWSAAYAGAIATMSTPFAMDVEGRKAHISHLSNLLEDPICLSRQHIIERDSLTLASGCPLQTNAIEHLPSHEDHTLILHPVRDDGLALLMLTSGSTGHSKAVELTHTNLIKAVQGKSERLRIPQHTSFLNFIGLDHVASLTEIHLHALFEHRNQVHVQSSEMIARPLSMLQLAHEHRVSKTVAPNFFLAKLYAAMVEAGPSLSSVDLSAFTHVISGGEANPTSTVEKLSKLLTQYGMPANAIMPAFGMTETCAGIIYNSSAPMHDSGCDYEFCSLGTCNPDIEMRISPRRLDGDDNMQIGNLEITGPALFRQYYRNLAATATAFTPDGWFITGDEGFIDTAGHLVLSGRTKDLVSVNGVKYLPHEIEEAISLNVDPVLVEPGFTTVFAFRRAEDQTERVGVTYIPRFSASDRVARRHALEQITHAVVVHTRSSPTVLALTHEAPHMQRSSLGKLSRSKIRTAFLAGLYDSYTAADAALSTLGSSENDRAFNATETAVADAVSSVLSGPRPTLDESLISRGVTSLELIRLKRALETAFALAPDAVPLVTVMTAHSVRALSAALAPLLSPSPTEAVAQYNPIVPLRPPTPANRHKTPLFLLHPGVGEVVAFFPLAQGLRTARPVYALRAAGFNPGERPIAHLPTLLETYLAAIRATQPTGPYALAGYSWGGMLAFELGKRLEGLGERVAFCGVLNLPPHIKWRMRQLSWAGCLAHLALFAGLVANEEAVPPLVAQIAALEKSEAVAKILEVGDESRAAELGLTHAALGRWTDLAHALQRSASDYEPAGRVERLDVFYCAPLTSLGLSVESWRETHLEPWRGFAADVHFHRVPGRHYTMLSSQHVAGFLETFEAVLQQRGV